MKQVLACDTCGSRNLTSYFAKNEHETCREYGCFGKMKMMPEKEATKLWKVFSSLHGIVSSEPFRFANFVMNNYKEGTS